MTIIIDQPDHFGVEEEEKIQNNEKELVLDGGFTLPEGRFLVPGNNSFGHGFRDYDAESARQEGVENFYRINHISQSVDFVKRTRENYGKLDKVEMSIWECCELLNDVVDESDPDLDEPQIEHLLQTAEAIRRDYPHEDWLHLTGLIHDLGKVLLHPSFGELPQWAVVGDTYPVGCAFDESIVHHKYFKENADYNNPAYNTKYGTYFEGCGLNNVMMSWGHDDYMYLVLLPSLFPQQEPCLKLEFPNICMKKKTLKSDLYGSHSCRWLKRTKQLYPQQLCSSSDTTHFMVCENRKDEKKSNQINMKVELIQELLRFHAALHRSGAYKHLMNEEDTENLKWLQIFNKYDLYSKSKVRIDVERVKPYYLSLIKKYFPEKLRW